MPSSLIAPAITSGLSYGASKLFGGGDTSAPLRNFQPAGINAGGLTSMFGADGNIHVAPSGQRMGFVQGISDAFGAQAGEIGALRSKVAPGYSELRASRLNEIENAKTAAIGNLRENLQRRRVLGSSFGQDTISRAEAEFGDAKGRASAETFLQEMEATNQLINQEFGAKRAAFQTGLDELNLEANLAAQLSGKATESMAANARMLSQLNMLEAQSAGKFFGQTFEPVFKGIGNTVGGFFASPGGRGGMSTAYGAS